MAKLILRWIGMLWITMSAHTWAGVDPAVLTALEARIRGGEFPGIHAVVVVQRGQALAQWYFEGEDETILKRFGHVKFTPDTLHDVRSVTKSVVSMLFGIAVGDGLIRNLDTPVLEYFPEYADLHTPERMRITLRHLLTMSSGFRWDETTYPYSDPRNSEIAMDIADDPFRYVLSQEIVHAPGEGFLYSGGDVALIGEVIARAAGKSLDAYAQEKLFAPLGITFEWSKNGDMPRAASGLRLTPNDMAILGQIMANGGVWKEQQIVPAAWVTESTQPHARVSEGACGTTYGYLWWLGAGCEATPPTPWIAGIGNGGQRIWMVPSRDLVVVITAGLYNDPAQRPVLDALLRVIGDSFTYSGSRETSSGRESSVEPE